MLTKNSWKIQDVFTYLIAKSTFPSISWLDFSNWANWIGTIDGQYCKVADVDRIFIQVNVELEESHEDNPDWDLCRYEFYEIIVRLAYCKYFESKICSSISGAVTKYLTENVFPMTNESAFLNQKFRDRFLWNWKVDDLYRANLTSLKKLYKFKLVHGQKILPMESLFDLMNDIEYQIPEKKLIQFFAQSKMHILDEMNEKWKYERIEFVEFLEFLARVADYKFRDTTLTLY